MNPIFFIKTTMNVHLEHIIVTQMRHVPTQKVLSLVLATVDLQEVEPHVLVIFFKEFLFLVVLVKCFCVTLCSYILKDQPTLVLHENTKRSDFLKTTAAKHASCARAPKLF